MSMLLPQGFAQAHDRMRAGAPPVLFFRYNAETLSRLQPNRKRVFCITDRFVHMPLQLQQKVLKLAPTSLVYLRLIHAQEIQPAIELLA